ncbi:arsenate reductase ArsC [Candidatus Auribacterota bacterium]
MKKKKILILCTGNSCRSQMAEGILRHLGGDTFEVYSAGVNPTAVNPLSVIAMKEINIDISSHGSKSTNEFLGKKFDHVITVCDNAKQACPSFPGKYKKLHWDLEDPADAQGSIEERMVFFRKIRDQIKDRASEFVESEG